MHELAKRIIDVIGGARLDLQQEKVLQKQLETLFKEKLTDITFEREKIFDPRNVIDFLFEGGLGLEVKINKGAKISIYKQCERYCMLDEVKGLILCTARSMGFPKEINGKPCYYININKAWL